MIRRSAQVVLFLFVFCESMRMRGMELFCGCLLAVAGGLLIGAVELCKAEGLL